MSPELRVLATAEIYAGFLFHSPSRNPVPSTQAQSMRVPVSKRPALPVTGTAGGIGSQLALRLQDKLSPEASFISSPVLGLYGGML